MSRDLVAEVAEALSNAADNGYPYDPAAESLIERGYDLTHNGVFPLTFETKVREALIEHLLTVDLPTTLNKVQFEGLTHRLLDPVHAIRFALSVYDGLDFLKCWNEGDWRNCMQWTTWKDFK